jgi:adenosylcobinamide hydrolase
MRYYLENTTLFIRGSFRAASTGISGGVRNVSTLLNHATRADLSEEDTKRELEFAAASAGITKNYLGLLTPGALTRPCVLQYDFVTVFISAGCSTGSQVTSGPVNIIITSAEGLSDAALLGLIMVSAEAKADVLMEEGLMISGTPSDAVIVACEGEEKHHHACRATDAGMRVRDAILFGLRKALKREAGVVRWNRPLFFVFSRFRGEHWVEWSPKNCPYYPCHFHEQSCDFCYCPLYTCGDESLGQWVESSNGGDVWNCSQCTLLHEPEIADYLKKNPDAQKGELLRLRDRKKR